jgi:hypothetical protein
MIDPQTAYIVDLNAQIDALTARVAELESNQERILASATFQFERANDLEKDATRYRRIRARLLTADCVVVSLSDLSGRTWTLRPTVSASGDLCVWVARNHLRRNLASEMSICFPAHGSLLRAWRKGQVQFSGIQTPESDGTKIEASPAPSVRIARR